jgi:hypothetical protein
MLMLGLVITFATIATLVLEFLRKWRAPLPVYAWAAFGALVAGWTLMFRGVYPVTVYFTPIAWTCYILLVDGAALAVSGRSRLRENPREFALLALLSIPLWLIFEAYNLRLRNWTYVGVPSDIALALLGYAWSFATITPAMLQTADLVESFGWFAPARPLQFSAAAKRGMMVFGATCLAVPLLLPSNIAAYVFALVWIGFVFLLDPLNHRLGLPSLVGDFSAGRRSRFWCLLVAGWTCGWLWEFWNYWAAAKWHYTFPMFRNLKIFEMPLPGYLGFLPFALECFAMYVTARWLLQKAGVRLRVASWCNRRDRQARREIME